MQIYSLNYFLANKMLVRSILGLILVCVYVLSYWTIVNQKKLRIPFLFLCILLFFEFLMYFFDFSTFVLYCFSMKIVADHFQP